MPFPFSVSSCQPYLSLARSRSGGDQEGPSRWPWTSRQRSPPRSSRFKDLNKERRGERGGGFHRRALLHPCVIGSGHLANSPIYGTRRRPRWVVVPATGQIFPIRNPHKKKRFEGKEETVGSSLAVFSSSPMSDQCRRPTDMAGERTVVVLPPTVGSNKKKQ